MARARIRQLPAPHRQPSIRPTPARIKGACGVAARWPAATLDPDLRRPLVLRYRYGASECPHLAYGHRVDELPIGLRLLSAAETKEQLINAVWDLRDSAYDAPDTWTAFSAEVFFQCLGEELERGSADGGSAVPADLLARAVGRARE